MILGLLRSHEIICGNPSENHTRMENHSVAAVRKLYSVFDLFAELSHWQWYVVFYTGFIINKPYFMKNCVVSQQSQAVRWALSQNV